MSTAYAEMQREFATELACVARQWRDRANERLNHLGFNVCRWVVLRALSEADEGISQTALAEEAKVEPPTLVRLIDDLERQGLVKRRQCPKDRRVNRIALTLEALPVFAKMNETIEKLRRESTADIWEQDLQAANAVLRRLKRNLMSL